MLIKNRIYKIKPAFTAILVLLGHSARKQNKSVAPSKYQDIIWSKLQTGQNSYSC